jgi:hypothetical protein
MTHMQAVPLSARKASGGNSEGIAPFLQLPHFTEATVKKIARKVFPHCPLKFFLQKVD